MKRRVDQPTMFPELDQVCPARIRPDPDKKERPCGQRITHLAWMAVDDSWSIDGDGPSGPWVTYQGYCRDHAGEVAGDWLAQLGCQDPGCGICQVADPEGLINPRIGVLLSGVEPNHHPDPDGCTDNRFVIDARAYLGGDPREYLGYREVDTVAYL